MIFVIISSNHNLSATLLLQPFPPSSSPSSRLRCGVVCPLVVCRELTAAMAARCLKNDALSPTRSPRWGLQTGNAVMFCVFRQYKPSLRVYYFLDKLLKDFLNLLFEETWRQSRLGLQGKACKTRTFPRLLLSIVFLNSFRTWFWFSVGDWKTVAALAAHEFFVEGVVRFSFVEHCWMDCPNSWCFAFRGNWPSSVVRSSLFEMCWIYAERLVLISKGFVPKHPNWWTLQKSFY